MAKYTIPTETAHFIAIFNIIIDQLAKENTKFQYAVIKSSAQAKGYELTLPF